YRYGNISSRELAAPGPPPPAAPMPRRSLAQTVVKPASEASVAPAPPAGAHHVRSPTMPSAVTPRSAWQALTAFSVFGPNWPSAGPARVGRFVTRDAPTDLAR